MKLRGLICTGMLFIVIALTGCGDKSASQNIKSQNEKIRSKNPDNISQINNKENEALGEQKDNNSQSEKKVSSTSSVDNATPNAFSAYKAVLLNEAKFTTDNKGTEVYLKDYPYLDHVIYFALVDLDGDGVSEVIVKETYDEIDANDCRAVVLHYGNNKVYGYFFGAGLIYNVKKDGTFSYSGGDGDGCVKIHSFVVFPDPDNPPIQSNDFLCFYDKHSVEYNINDQPVSKKKLDAFIETQKLKDNAVWNILNKENIESHLVNK
ncbi:hypothetical protein [Acetivibrio cellulolyticus]|uniref:hypothetical protein n=1 Tax=Acetivibrio cellulolyticus TaxID=35830 RepID=UPI0001E2C7E1|nr:hypothetical protein [Acetivibrio cellulolyticus]